MKNLAIKYRYELLMAFIFIIMGIAGSMDLEDQVLQHKSNCEHAVFAVNQYDECGGYNE